MLLIHDIKYSDLLYNWKELQPGESGTITVSYEAEQPGDFYRTVGHLWESSEQLADGEFYRDSEIK